MSAILVALSGGVDSSVAALLLLEQGHRLMSATLKTFCYGDIPGGPKSCCGLEGVAMARAVAAGLGIPHTIYDVTDRFRSEVVEDFINEYASGRTPNPCVICNATVKIPDLWERAQRLGCDAVATGHYARTEPTAAGMRLFRGLDAAKDQSYFLWSVPASVIEHLRLPLGNLTKARVRELAAAAHLENAAKPESQEICFIPGNNYLEFLRRYLPADHPGFQSGDIVDTTGTVIGRHQGYLGYTIGQRKGLGGGHGRRLFVTGIDTRRNVVCVGEENELVCKRLQVCRLNVLAPEAVQSGCEYLVQYRHRSKPVPARLIDVNDRFWNLEFVEPAKSVTPGQSAVLYMDDMVVAGGRISDAMERTQP